jgi:hypothetical protein
MTTLEGSYKEFQDELDNFDIHQVKKKSLKLNF